MLQSAAQSGGLCKRGNAKINLGELFLFLKIPCALEPSTLNEERELFHLASLSLGSCHFCRHWLERVCISVSVCTAEVILHRAWSQMGRESHAAFLWTAVVGFSLLRTLLFLL